MDKGFHALHYAAFGAVTLLTALICVCLGSVNIPLGETLNALAGKTANSIITNVRFPRVLATALAGASLSICGAAMQGLLKNPLADGSTLGVASGASLGAVIAMAIPALTVLRVPLAMLGAFVSLLLILSLAYKLDYSLSTNTIILIGVIFTMFASSIINLLVTFAGERVRSIMFWTMGSLSGMNYVSVFLLAACLLVFGGAILRYARELNAFAIGEDNARSIGVPVKKVKLIVLICASCLIGVCVSVSGTIGFVGLVVPHMARLIIGPNHKRLLSASIFGGAVFLMLADLLARTMLSPKELPIGVVTSFVGSIVFVYIFAKARYK